MKLKNGKDVNCMMHEFLKKLENIQSCYKDILNTMRYCSILSAIIFGVSQLPVRDSNEVIIAIVVSYAFLMCVYYSVILALVKVKGI